MRDFDEIRYLSNDEVLFDVKSEGGGGLNCLTACLEKFKSNISNRIFYMNKIIYLSRDLEEKDNKTDPIRCELVCHEILNQMKEGRFQLEMEDYMKYSAYYA